ncbi:MAG: type IVB secretion system protein IcmV [Legionellaceae bacterium]|nr:type IVB secretion system protein IcmV [Legionellaceae bacterium]
MNFSDSRLKRIIDKYFNVRAWSDWDRSQSIATYFLTILRRLFVPQQAKKKDIKSFEEVVKELQLTDEELQSRAKNLKQLCFFMIGIGGFFYCYAMYQLLYGGVLGVILSCVLMLISFALAFRYHFWYFQIGRRKLGCKISEWFKESFMGDNQ